MPGISLQDFKHPLIFSQNVEESCTFQKIYGLGKDKLKIKWPGSFCSRRVYDIENMVDIKN